MRRALLSPQLIHTHTVNTDIHQDSTIDQLPEAAKETTQKAIDVTRQAVCRATDAAKGMYQTAALKAEDTLTSSKEYVRRNPVPVILGAIVFGAAIGYLVVSARRRPTFGERFADEPLVSVREAILGALTPVAESVHDGYDSARNSMGKAMHRFGRRRSGGPLSERICRVGSNLKFW
jgi:ElaB/YqjD/DUF883 family membrane-anchored ribosome-binding protein